jgi:hypothetical protein
VEEYQARRVFDTDEACLALFEQQPQWIEMGSEMERWAKHLGEAVPVEQIQSGSAPPSIERASTFTAFDTPSFLSPLSVCVHLARGYITEGSNDTTFTWGNPLLAFACAAPINSRNDVLRPLALTRRDASLARGRTHTLTLLS